MNFSDDELSALYAMIVDQAVYGDDEIVYGDGPEAFMIRNLLDKIAEEARRRNSRRAR